mgnify:CR=1 FL=1
MTRGRAERRGGDAPGFHCPHCGKRITAEFSVLPQGAWKANDLVELAAILNASGMTLGDLLSEMRAAARAAKEGR